MSTHSTNIVMGSPNRIFLSYIFIILYFSCWSSSSFASIASNTRLVVVSPFSYSEDGVPANVKEEMSISVDLPRLIVDYFKKVEAFKSVSLSDLDTKINDEADIFLHGEVLYVQGGNGAARYFGNLGGAGRASMLIEIKVFDADGKLLHEGRIAQEGTKGTNVFTAWSNKKNITSAINALPQKILPVAIGGDLTTPEGVIRAVEYRNALAIRAAAQSSRAHGLFKERRVTDAMESMVLQGIGNGYDDRYFIDSVAWCLINIGASGDDKYAESLAKIVDSDSHNKIKKHARNALDKIRDANR